MKPESNGFAPGGSTTSPGFCALSGSAVTECSVLASLTHSTVSPTFTVALVGSYIGGLSVILMTSAGAASAALAPIATAIATLTPANARRFVQMAMPVRRALLPAGKIDKILSIALVFLGAEAGFRPSPCRAKRPPSIFRMRAVASPEHLAQVRGRTQHTVSGGNSSTVPIVDLLLSEDDPREPAKAPGRAAGRADYLGRDHYGWLVGAPDATLSRLRGGVLDQPRSQFQAVRVGPDRDPRPVANFAQQQLAPERGLQLTLDHAPQRPRAVNRIVTVLGEVVARLVGQLELDLAIGEPLAQPF